MKAIILAGGHATRLWPITKDRAKPLLPLGEKPIIDFIVSELQSEGIEEILISTNQKFETDFEEYIEEYGKKDISVVVEDQSSEDEKPGTIGAVLKILEQEDIDDDLLIVGGDNYFPFDFSDLCDLFREKQGVINAVYDVENKKMAEQFGIVDSDSETKKITDFEEKPDEPPSTLASTACYVFPKEEVSLFHEYEDYFKETDIPKEKYLDEPGRLIEWAHTRAPMYAFSFSGDWFDIGTPEGYLSALESVMDESIVRGNVEDSEIGENVLVMEGAEVRSSKIRKSVLFPKAKIKDSAIQNSIVDKEVEIEDRDMNDAVIGKHSQL